MMGRYEGHNGQIDIDGDELVLTREGMVARAAYGKDIPPRHIPLAAISGVRVRPATRLRNGSLQLLVGGADPGVPGSNDHPDLVLFTWAKREQFAELERLLTATAERNNATGDPATAAQAADAGTAGRMQRASEKLTAAAERHQPTGGTRTSTGTPEEPVLWRGTSHEAGRNAVITLYPDRLERQKAAKLTGLSNARQDLEETPVRVITSVQAKKDGLTFTKVTVYASGNNIEFRFTHADAERFRQVLGPLIRGGHDVPAAAAAPAVPNMAERLRELAALRNEGLLTDEEFAAQKAKLLGS